MSSPSVLDQEAIANLRALSPDDGDVFLKEILGIFLEDTPARIAELHASKSRGDGVSFTRAAHSIKGSSSNVGALELRASAERLEAHSKQQGLDGTDPLVLELTGAFTRVEIELRKLLV
jgi:HPt (histidine-containing phosphotransfer) domain-containing protein